MRSVILFLAIAYSGLAIAQPTQIVEDKHVGFRLTIPKNWTWQKRQDDVFINCAPDKNENGRPGCWFTIRKISAPPDQRTITDADRTKWKGWISANGMRPILSARDLRIAGFPAYEIVAKIGTYRTAGRERRVMILIPGKGKVFDSWFLAEWGDKDYYDQYNPAFGAALETLVPLP